MLLLFTHVQRRRCHPLRQTVLLHTAWWVVLATPSRAPRVTCATVQSVDEDWPACRSSVSTPCPTHYTRRSRDRSDPKSRCGRSRLQSDQASPSATVTTNWPTINTINTHARSEDTTFTTL